MKSFRKREKFKLALWEEEEPLEMGERPVCCFDGL